MGKSADYILNEMIHDGNFESTIQKSELMARRLTLGTGSLGVRGCLSSDEPQFGPVPKDPFLASISTQRTARENQMNYLYGESIRARNIEHCRTKGNIPEYGNFSRYNAILERNKSALINR